MWHFPVCVFLSWTADRSGSSGEDVDIQLYNSDFFAIRVSPQIEIVLNYSRKSLNANEKTLFAAFFFFFLLRGDCFLLFPKFERSICRLFRGRWITTWHRHCPMLRNRNGNHPHSVDQVEFLPDDCSGVLDFPGQTGGNLEYETIEFRFLSFCCEEREENGISGIGLPQFGKSLAFVSICRSGYKFVQRKPVSD